MNTQECWTPYQKSIVKHWLRLSRYAASGGNQQAWDIQINATNNESGRALLQLQKPKGENWTDRFGAGAVTSLGCLVTLMKRTSEILGLALSDLKFIDSEDYWNCRVEMSFTFTDKKTTDFSLSHVLKRRTHRGAYKKIHLPIELTKKHFDFPHKQMFFLLDPQKKQITQYLKETTLLRLTNKNLFFELLDEVRTIKEKNIEKTGLPINTLGISKFSQWMFLLIKYLRIYLSFKPLHWMTLQESVVSPIKNCSHIYYLQGNEDKALSWFEMGMTFQEYWLNITKDDIVLQPFANNLLIYNYFKNKKDYIFNKDNQEVLEKWENILKEEFNINPLVPGILFRIGRAIKPVPLSPRKPIIF